MQRAQGCAAAAMYWLCAAASELTRWHEVWHRWVSCQLCAPAWRGAGPIWRVTAPAVEMATAAQAVVEGKTARMMAAAGRWQSHGAAPPLQAGRWTALTSRQRRRRLHRRHLRLPGRRAAARRLLTTRGSAACAQTGLPRRRWTAGWRRWGWDPTTRHQRGWTTAMMPPALSHHAGVPGGALRHVLTGALTTNHHRTLAPAETRRWWWRCDPLAPPCMQVCRRRQHQRRWQRRERLAPAAVT